jgi:WD40-like Beta Propeller Repeat
MALNRAGAALCAALIAGAEAPGPAGGLEPGMQLLYESEGEAQPPWTVDSVRREAGLRERSACAVVHLRRRPDQPAPEELRLCLANDTLYRWDPARADWSVQRPVGPAMSWTSRQPGGEVVRYETGARATEVISGRDIAVVETTVTTSDTAGRPKRRLRERYALALATATGGTFEIPDTTRPGTWRVQRRFELREIRPPAGRPPVPELIGAGTVSVGNVFRGTFTPDGDTLYFFKNVTEGEEDYRIFRAHRSGNSWSRPEPVDFGGEHSDLYPAMTPDGRRMVFSSYRPAPGDPSAHPSAYLWYVERNGGRWGSPVFMAEATAWGHYHSQPIFDARGDLYFNRSSWDYRGHSEHVSRWNGTRYGRPEASAAWDAARRRLAPGQYLYETTPGYDGSFALLVIGERPDSGRPGPPDLHVSFRSGTKWTAPRPLGAGVNSPKTENFAFYSPDGRDLYFVREFAGFYRVPLREALGPR